MQTKNKTKKILTTLLSILIPIFVVSGIALAVTTIGTNIITQGDLTVDTNTLYVDSTNHKVGIGTTTPTQTLDIVGSVNATTYYGDGSNLTGIVPGKWSDASGGIYYNSGKVGIGTNSPLYTLHVSGGADIDGVGEVTSSDTDIPNLDLYSWSYGERSIYVSGNYAYVTSYSGDALDIIDISDPTNPDGVGEVTESDPDITYMDYGRGVFVSGNYAYLAVEPGLVIVDISDPANPDGVGEVLFYEDADVSGMLDNSGVFVSGNYAYITSTSSNGSLNVVDISDPTNPDGVASFTGDSEVTMDEPYALFISGNYAYITNAGGNSLSVVDISNPLNPNGVGEVTKSDPDIANMNGPFSVFVSGDYAYVAAKLGDALDIIDISTPTSPNGVGEITKNDDSDISNMEEPRSVYVVGNYAYLVSLTGDALAVIDISDPANPDGIAQITKNDDSDISNMDNPISVYVSGNYAYVASGGGDAVDVIQVKGIVDTYLSGNTQIYESGAGAALTVTQAGGGDILNLYDESTQVLAVSDGGNLGIGTENQFGSGQGVLSLGNAAAAPSTALTNASLFYASLGEMYVYDASGNATQISPHNELGQWIFKSENKVTGRSIEINMEEVIKAVEQLTGQNFICETLNGIPTSIPGLELDEESDLFLDIPTSLDEQEEQNFLTTFEKQVKQALSSLGILIEQGFTNLENLFVKEIFIEKANIEEANIEKAKIKKIEGLVDIEKVRLNQIEIIDKATQEIYCLWIENGEWMKQKGTCNSLSQNVNQEEAAASQENESFPEDSGQEPIPEPSEPPLEEAEGEEQEQEPSILGPLPGQIPAGEQNGEEQQEEVGQF